MPDGSRGPHFQAANRSTQGLALRRRQYSAGNPAAMPHSGSQTMPRAAGYGEQGQRAASRGYGSSGGYQSPAYHFGDRRGYAQPGGGYGRYDYRGYFRPPHF